MRTSNAGTPTAGDAEGELYTELRPLLFSIAYRMLASVSDAEDVVQEAFLRYHQAVGHGTVADSPKAYLSAVTTRLSIDQLRSARARRESYVGNWLPEPLLTDPAAADPAEDAERADTLSMAFLLVLERLDPVQRAVFLLHDVFGYGYPEIARIVGRSEANCRQIATRARAHVARDRPRFETTRTQRDELAKRFLAAMGDGDLDGLLALLGEDAVVVGDSGGRTMSWPQVISGRERAGRLLASLGHQLAAAGVRIDAVWVNGQPGAVFRDEQDRLTNVFSLEIHDGRVQAVRSVINPDKLRHLGPLADIRELAARRRR